MLLPSPTQATGLASDGAAVLDVGEDVGQDLAGWNSLVRPLMTGTREWAAKRSILACSKVRIITRSTMRLMTRAVLDGLGAAELAVAGGQVHHRRPSGTCRPRSSRACACWPSRRSWPACGRPGLVLS